jgi:hypothetical protein
MLSCCQPHPPLQHFKFISLKFVASDSQKLSRYDHAGDKEESRYSSYSFLNSPLDGVSC